MQAILVETLGGPEQLVVRELPTPEPGPGQIRVDVTAAGVNFMDTGARRLGAATGRLPFTPGVEGAGRVSALGEGIDGLAVGDRVAWVYAYGSYAQQLVLPAVDAVPLPDDIPDQIAASVMMQGITAHHFTTEAAPVQPGQTTLVHAAAGGLGQKLTRLIKHQGGDVIALVSNQAKADLARAGGADHVLVSTGDAFVDRVLELTHGQGVHTVFDGGGETTFRASLKVVRRHGTLLYYGAVLGAAPVVNLRELPRSIKICYPVFRDHIPDRQTLQRRTAELFTLLRNGTLTPGDGGRTYHLHDAAQAHRDLESRATTGKLLLLP
jgi:NADPH:quinone reductase-like Zn-dependent oxidoreductase